MRLIELTEYTKNKQSAIDDDIVELAVIAFNNNNLNESFLDDNKKILMPIVNVLMKTAARAILYKLWKRSPNAVLALAAIKKLKDQGDQDPIGTIMRLSNLGVSYKFMKRLAYDAGVFDIGGVRPDHKPPMVFPIITDRE